MRPETKLKPAPQLEEDASQHLWAVSYADMLMVLMSFFIIYFQFDELQSSKNPLAALAFALQGKLAQVVPPPAPVARSPEEGKENGHTQNPYSTQGDHSSLNVLLRDKAFEPGGHRLDGEAFREFVELLEEMKPFLGKGLKLIIVGHADEDLVEKPVQGEAVSRFALLALRSAEGVSVAVAHGIPAESLGLEADLSGARKARSLSIKVSEVERHPAPVPVSALPKGAR